MIKAVPFLILWLLVFGMLYAGMNSAIKEDELRDGARLARSATLDEVKKGWICDKKQCCFSGLTYCTPTDQRFNKGKKNDRSAKK
jgi:hypothetical protein